MRTKRFLSVLLTLSMIISLFAGMSTGITVPVEAAEDAPSTAKIGSYTIAVPKGVVQGDVSDEPTVVTAPKPNGNGRIDKNVVWGSEGETTWYVVAEDVTMDIQELDPRGDVNLILPKGKELKINTEYGINFSISSSTLTIWETIGGGGTLSVSAVRNSVMYTNYNTFTINGGNVVAETSGQDTIHAKELIINGGAMTVRQTKASAEAGEAEWYWGHAINDTSLVIKGGELTASVNPNSSKVAFNQSGAGLYIDTGAIIEDTEHAIGEQKYLHITVPEKKKVSDYTFKEITGLAELADSDKVKDATALADRYTGIGLEDGCWYVVEDDVTINGNITVYGKANLILMDGKKLTVNGGINGNSITIWGQKKGTGTMTASGDGSSKAITVDELIINGGTVESTDAIYIGRSCTMTVNGGTVNTINNSGHTGDAAILNNSGTLTVNGGNVNARGTGWTEGIQIHTLEEPTTFVINGGVVNAYGNSGLRNIEGTFIVRGGEATFVACEDNNHGYDVAIHNSGGDTINIEPHDGANIAVWTANNAEGNNATLSTTSDNWYYTLINVMYVKIRVGFAGHVMPDKLGFDLSDYHVPHGTTGMWDKITAAGGELASGNYYLGDDVTLTGANLTIPEGATVNLCLNGYTLTGKSGSSIITVGTGATLNLYDCGKNSRNCAVGIDGKWTLDEDCENSIVSGTIIGGVITGGTDGGVTVNGTLNLQGGNIVGNNGGGVTVNSGATLTVGGTAVVKGNTKDGKASNVILAKDTYISFGNHEESHEEPVEGCNGVLAPITIISDKNKNKMEIYVTTTTDTNVYNSEGDIIAETATDYTNCIKSDNATRKVVLDGGKLKLFKGHVHKWNYTADGAKLYAYCTETEDASACGYQGTENKVVLTLSVSTSNYSGESEIVSAGNDEEQFLWKMALGEASIPAVHYVGRAGNELADTTTEPTTKGHYTAYISAGAPAATASIDYDVVEKHIHSFTYSANGATLTATCGTSGDLVEACNLLDNKAELTLLASSENCSGISGLDEFNEATKFSVSESQVEIYRVKSSGATTGGNKVTVTKFDVEGGHFYASLTVGDYTIVKAFTVDFSSVGYAIFADGTELSWEGLRKEEYGTKFGYDYSAINTTSVEMRAFKDCSSLKSIVFPEGLTTIGNSAFEGCSQLTNVTLPTSLTTIGNSAFEDCSSLTSVTLPAELETIGSYAFRNCSGLLSVEFEGTVGTNGSAIGNYAFLFVGSWGASDNPALILPDAWNDDFPNDYGAFHDGYFNWIKHKFIYTADGDTITATCNKGHDPECTESVFLTLAPTPINCYRVTGLSNFNHTTGKVITKNDVEIYKVDTKGATTGGTKCAEAPTEEGYYYASLIIDDVKAVKAFTLDGKFSPLPGSATFQLEGEDPVTLTWDEVRNEDNASKYGYKYDMITDASIGKEAFSHCNNLISITIPIQITTIEESAFNYCGNLTSVTMQDSIETIGDIAFNECGLTSLTIPASVEKIGSGAFSWCTGLTSVTFKGTVGTNGSGMGDSIFFFVGEWDGGVNNPTLRLPAKWTDNLPDPTWGEWYSGYFYLIPAHVHSWEYSLDGTDTIIAHCTADGHEGDDVSLTLTASSVNYSGTAYTGASLGDTTDWSDEELELTVPEIKFVGRGSTTYEESTTAPTAIGTYTAKITVGDKTATVDFSINMQITVKTLAGKTITLEVLPGDTVLSVKQKVQSLESIPTDQQRMIFGGTELVNTKTLNECGVQNGSEINLVLRVHAHNWVYSSNGATLTAICNGERDCTVENGKTTGVSLTLTASSANYSAIEGLDAFNTATGRITDDTKITESDVLFYTVTTAGATSGGTNETSTAPTADGYYYASLTVGTATAVKAFTIGTPGGLTHTHGSWDYSASGATLTAECKAEGECDLTDKKVSLTISAADADYSGSAVVATLGTTTAWTVAGLKVPVIEYVDKAGNVSETAPTAIGIYTARITAGGQTATKDFRIIDGSSPSPSPTEAPIPTSTPVTPKPTVTPAPGSVPKQYTIPVRGDESAVKVAAEITDGNAVISEITEKTLETIVKEAEKVEESNTADSNVVDTITIDLSGAKQEIVAATLSASSIETLADILNDASNTIDKVEIKLTNASVVFDSKALNSLAEQITGKNITLVVEKVDADDLNAKQQKALKNDEVMASFNIYLVSDGEEIHEFDGGQLDFSIKFKNKKDTDRRYYHVVYVAENGDKEYFDTEYVNDIIKFSTPHCSNYVIVYDETRVNNTVAVPGKEQIAKNNKIINIDLHSSIKSGKLTVKWSKIDGAMGYDVFVAACDGKSFAKKPAYTAAADEAKAVLTEYKGEDFAVGGYKVKVRAFMIIDGKKTYIATSSIVHASGNKSKYTNAKTVIVNEKALKLAKGETAQLEAKMTVADSKKKVMKHMRGYRFFTLDKDVATVDKSGKIVATGSGSTTVYVMAANGVKTAVEVTVK